MPNLLPDAAAACTATARPAPALPLSADLLAPYAGQVRVRVGGLLFGGPPAHPTGAVLLAAHRGLLPAGALFWSPPGGGWQFGESLHDALRREFREETGLAVAVGALLHVHEFRQPAAGLQAVELFFRVDLLASTATPRLGSDPEHAPEAQLLRALAWFAPAQWCALPAGHLHPVVAGAGSVAALQQPGGLWPAGR